MKKTLKTRRNKKKPWKFTFSEAITHPINTLEHFLRQEFVLFLMIGASGVLLSLLVLLISVEFFLGRENYIVGFIISYIVNLIYNFFFYAKLFKKEKKKLIAFIKFIIYILIHYHALKYSTITLVEMTSEDYYFIITAILIFLYSIVNYFCFKKWVFNNN